MSYVNFTDALTQAKRASQLRGMSFTGGDYSNLQSSYFTGAAERAAAARQQALAEQTLADQQSYWANQLAQEKELSEQTLAQQKALSEAQIAAQNEALSKSSANNLLQTGVNMAGTDLLLNKGQGIKGIYDLVTSPVETAKSAYNAGLDYYNQLTGNNPLTNLGENAGMDNASGQLVNMPESTNVTVVKPTTQALGDISYSSPTVQGASGYTPFATNASLAPASEIGLGAGSATLDATAAGSTFGGSLAAGTPAGGATFGTTGAIADAAGTGSLVADSSLALGEAAGGAASGVGSGVGAVGEASLTAAPTTSGAGASLTGSSGSALGTAGSGLGTVGAGYAAPALLDIIHEGATENIGEIANLGISRNNAKFSQTTGSIGTGAAAGAYVGTYVFPVVGTALGAVLGGIGGGLYSAFSGGEDKPPTYTYMDPDQFSQVQARTVMRGIERGEQPYWGQANQDKEWDRAYQLYAQYMNNGFDHPVAVYDPNAAVLTKDEWLDKYRGDWKAPTVWQGY